MKILQQQLNALRQMLVERANRNLADYARRRFPQQFEARSFEEIFALISRVRAAANGHGIEREDDVATFLDLTVMYGADFDRSTWAREVITASTLHGPDKMAVLRHLVTRAGATL